MTHVWCAAVSEQLHVAVQRLEREVERLAELREKREAAAGASAVMAPIASRKLRKEAQQVRALHSAAGVPVN
jgi:hypothetical protein